VWRTDALVAALDGYRGRSLYRLLGPLQPVRVHLPAAEDGRAPWFDCDTMDDLGVARERARGAEKRGAEKRGARGTRGLENAVPGDVPPGNAVPGTP
jgi:hypothetical protein